MKLLKKIFFVFIRLRLTKIKSGTKFNDLNFRKIDFTNYKQIRSFIFKKDFYKTQNKYVHNFDFLNFSQNLGGKIGINLSRKSIFYWYEINKFKFFFPWSEDLTSKRLINLIYNYEYISSSSSEKENLKLKKIINNHIYRTINDFNNKKINEITSYDLVAFFLSNFILGKLKKRDIRFLEIIVDNQVDNFGMHKSYNILEHSKFINNIGELKNIFLYFSHSFPEKIEKLIIKMTATLNEYFHLDGSFPLFNGSNNNYTDKVFKSLNKDFFSKSREFSNTKNGIAFYSDKNKKLFFDIVQPKNDIVSSGLSAGTLSFELSSFGEKIITNCGSSESFGKNPEYLRYSAAHSTIVLQNTNISEIKENNPHIKFPQKVSFDSNSVGNSIIFEGSHNGYIKKFKKILKRKIDIRKNESKIFGIDSLIATKETNDRTIFHIRFHLIDGINFNFTNNRKNIILKTKKNNIWLFKSDTELIVEDSIIVDKNTTIPTKQIVIKGIIANTKLVKKWSIEKI